MIIFSQHHKTFGCGRMAICHEKEKQYVLPLVQSISHAAIYMM